MENKIDIWYILNNMLTGKEELIWNEEIERIYNPFLINRVLSSENKYIKLVCLLNEKGKGISKQTHYKLLFKIVKKGKRFLKFFKEKSNDKNLEILSQYNMVGIDEVIQYSNLINCKDIDVFVNFLEAQNNPKFKKLSK